MRQRMALALCRRMHVRACVLAAGSGAATASARPAAIVLGIESSCDDTGAAVVTSDGRVLGEAIATQADIHAKWGAYDADMHDACMRAVTLTRPALRAVIKSLPV